MLKYVLLGFLNYQPLTGYDLELHIRNSTTHFWHARLSQIYMTLKELETEGLVRSEVEAQAKRPDRRVYSLTDAGRAAFFDWLAVPLTERSQAKEPLLLKLFFSAGAGKQAILKQLRIQLDLHIRHQKVYEGDIPDVAADLLNNHPQLQADALMWSAVRDFGARYERLYIAWLEDTIRKIEQDFPETS